MGAGKGWSELESLLACKAFVRVSEDPVVGNGRKFSQLVKAVQSHYETLVRDRLEADDVGKSIGNTLCEVVRTGEAIIKRYKKIRKACLEFEGCIKQVWTLKPTGDPTNDDVERAATAVLNGEADPAQMYSFNGGGELGNDFPFLRALQYLRTTNLWKTTSLAGKVNSVSVVANVAGLVCSSSPAGGGEDAYRAEEEGGSASTSPDPSKPMQRPRGTKRAKAKGTTNATLMRGAAGIEKLDDASNKRVKATEELVKVERMKAHMQLFSMPGSNPELQKKFVARMQEKALAEMKTSSATVEPQPQIPQVSVQA
eukprot:Plantae.Rhodophyta-Palmaria_palmata.ctg14079.p1 GENE.Plantae.Rhodophyta-Palmaria_palmata.ctg14079~~Plantae.Rhodophyta-Palmaria_palmata.ctg14079.p1  ORF type:complete len:321 (+),score=54.91 Plantae.Rhodophyta-Palmaria_palmata.ctg14079:28-963(+)